MGSHAPSRSSMIISGSMNAPAQDVRTGISGVLPHKIMARMKYGASVPLRVSGNILSGCLAPGGLRIGNNEPGTRGVQDSFIGDYSSVLR